MPGQIHQVVQYLRSAALRHDQAALTDGELLGRFLENRDQAALTALVHRHGSMVWGVCRRILRNHHDAEDAFQATFLVLVRNAASIRKKDTVGNWLYGVAQKSAVKARTMRARRNIRETQGMALPEPPAPERDMRQDVEAVLDQELSRLPDIYRSAIVLCDLEGKTREAAARQLGCPAGTVASRLTRARALLAKRLARHGFAVSSAVMAAVVSQKLASASVPTPVLSSTVHIVTLVAAGHTAGGLISSPVAALTKGVIKMLLLNKLMNASAALLVASAALIGSGGLYYMHAAQGTQPAAQEPGREPGKQAENRDIKKKPDPDLDQRMLKALLEQTKAEMEHARATAAMAEANLKHVAEKLRQLNEAYEHLTNTKSQGATQKPPAESFADFTGRLISMQGIMPGMMQAMTQGPTWRSAALPGKAIGISFEIDERSYLRFHRLHSAGKSPAAAYPPLDVGLADESGFPHAGQLDHLDQVFNPATGSIGAYGTLSNEDGLLRPGMFVRVRMRFDTAPPAQAGDKTGKDKVETPSLPRTLSSENTRGEDASKVRALLKERLEILRGLADRAKLLRTKGGASSEDVRNADLRVSKAELDLCETTMERVAVLEKIAKLCRENEDQVSRLAQQNAVSADEVLEAKLNRLDAEIAVAREKAKLGKQPQNEGGAK